ncbi:hypothetical protein GUITHDRAFT_150514 [Guillardia theta CCMP2712]|uniref:peptidylprolyl isomerase n=1 Tax=Guillardia theta (strain CCMP2712) TaxID=905079 RepID=L1JXX4_GUITC|nr:hypothetical protein GUITHDRAFT_150514 [Guillardia theta CCMP2712]EKX53065.1 hypothetical protein GUITHDRAFT_150514 [Guillardia theta CCMP2712]|eukprot:XP_005840045.1 hypothetical protein GUITHDRAFT_150514 [Guillardia theta CCMP2712]
MRTIGLLPLILTLLCLAGATESAEDSWIDIKGGDGVQYIVKEKGDCSSYVVQDDDIVFISHAGYLVDTRQQFDGNGDAFLKVKIGQGSIIKGMETGIKGQCVGETRIVRMPPHTAFDDPLKRFKSKPVPIGSTVEYHITVHGVQRPGTLHYYWVIMVEQGGVPGLIFLLIVLLACYGIYDSFSKSSRKTKSKRR